ncbi:MAG: sulfite exporter TauE/SafE family protein [Nitratireductor sp.]
MFGSLSGETLLSLLPAGSTCLSLTGCALVLAVAGFARGYGGFGFSAIAVAGAGFFLPLTVVVPLAILLEVAASVQMAPSVFRHVDWNRMSGLTAGAILGNPLGIAALQYASSQSVSLFVYGFILLAALILLPGKTRSFAIGNIGWFMTGLAAGAINGASALSGLFIVIVMTLSATDPSRMRATLIAYFFVSDLYAAIVMAWRGVIGFDILLLALVMLPVMGVSIMLGSRRFAGATDAEFRRAVLILLFTLAVTGLARMLV